MTLTPIKTKLLKKSPYLLCRITLIIPPVFKGLKCKERIDYLHIPNAPKSDGSIYATGENMTPLIKSGDIVVFKLLKNIPEDIFWGQMYIIDVDLDDDTLVTTNYLKLGKDKDHVLLVSENDHYQDKEIHIDRIKSIAHVKIIVRFS